MNTRMKVINLNFDNFDAPEAEPLPVQASQPHSPAKPQSHFCNTVLDIVRQTSLLKVQQLRSFLSFDKLCDLEAVLSFYLSHQNCTQKRQNWEEVAEARRASEEEHRRKDKRIAELENLHQFREKQLRESKQEILRQAKKIYELKVHLRSLERITKRNALSELNEYSQMLLKTFKIDKTGLMTPEEAEFNYRRPPSHQRLVRPKKVFVTEVRPENRSNILEVVVQTGPSATQRASKSQTTNRNPNPNCRMKSEEELQKLEEDKENCLNTMSSGIVIFQKKLAHIESKLAVKKKLVSSGQQTA